MTKQIPPKPTLYKGIEFKSRLEARWAVFFDGLKIRYQYEPYGEQTPDFEIELDGEGFKIEVKGQRPNDYYIQQLVKENVAMLAIGGFFKDRTPALYTLLVSKKSHTIILNPIDFFSMFHHKGCITAFNLACRYRFDLK